MPVSQRNCWQVRNRCHNIQKEHSAIGKNWLRQIPLASLALSHQYCCAMTTVVVYQQRQDICRNTSSDTRNDTCGIPPLYRTSADVSSIFEVSACDLTCSHTCGNAGVTMVGKQTVRQMLFLVQMTTVVGPCDALMMTAGRAIRRERAVIENLTPFPSIQHAKKIHIFDQLQVRPSQCRLPVSCIMLLLFTTHHYKKWKPTNESAWNGGNSKSLHGKKVPDTNKANIDTKHAQKQT